MMGRLSGKVAVITGGSSGIGLATAKLFVAEGAFVFITGRRQSELDDAVTAIGAATIGVQGDIAHLADLDRLFERVESVKGCVDILFANAGLGEFLPLGSITEAHYQKTFDVNVKGTLFTVQKALPLMPKGASIILNASIAASKGLPAFSVYGASKAALRAFVRGWAVDLKGRDIRVNVVSPGTVPTPGYDNLGLTEDQMGSFLAAQNAAIPLGRVGAPEEVARTVLFLASDDSSYVNGSELFVDGGLAQM
jgi:NAD(P)-dependent dehydrogenase (short-subunit alcohol dehydrogenase family)